MWNPIKIEKYRPVSLPFLLLFVVLVISSGAHPAEPGTQWIPGDRQNGSELFLAQAEQCLETMEEAAREMSVQGVAVVAFIPGERSLTWISRMKVVGKLSNGGANFLSVAYSKAGEMADTYSDSGSGVREPLHGEFGYQGGLIKKMEQGYILTVFSGASGEQDTEIARAGLEVLEKVFAR